MRRFSSAVAISILGYGFAYGCQQPAEDDDEGEASTTSVGIDASTSTGGTSGSTTSGSGTTSGSNVSSATSSGNGSTTTSGNSTTGGASTLEDRCPGITEGLSCGAGSESSKPNPVNMLIVLDKSGSMDQQSNGQQRWSAMKSALQSALTGAQDKINFGLELYPTPAIAGGTIDRLACGQAGNCCEMPADFNMNVPIGTGADAVNQIITELDATLPGGGTPTARALERALDYFTNGAGAQLEGDKFVLLATDGGPNCNADLTCGGDLCTYNLDDPSRDCTAQSADNNCCAGTGTGCVDRTNVTNRIENLANAGIPTFVVGIPGTEAYASYLNEFAVAGGRAVQGGAESYYRVDDVAQLASVFQEITVSLISSCDITLPQATTVAPRIIIDCDEVPRMAGAAGGSGTGENWTWASGSDQVTLVGDACERVQQGVNNIDVVLNCEIVQ